MGDLSGYLYGIICVAVICAVITTIAPKSKATGKVVQMLTGLILLFSILKPIKNIELGRIGDFTDDLSMESQRIIAAGVESSVQTLRGVIKQKCESYVMEKAKQLGADISVEIEIAEGNNPIPTAVKVTGTVSPYVKERLSGILVSDLNIPREQQKWI